MTPERKKELLEIWSGVSEESRIRFSAVIILELLDALDAAEADVERALQELRDARREELERIETEKPAEVAK